MYKIIKTGVNSTIEAFMGYRKQRWDVRIHMGLPRTLCAIPCKSQRDAIRLFEAVEKHSLKLNNKEDKAVYLAEHGFFFKVK